MRQLDPELFSGWITLVYSGKNDLLSKRLWKKWKKSRLMPG